MLAKIAFKNFFKRYKNFLICLGIFIFSLFVAVLVFIGGMQLVLSLQPNNLIDQVQNYFLTSFKIYDIYEVLNLSILKRVYNEISQLAENADSLKTGLFIVISICVFIIFGCHKGSIALINYLNKKNLKNQNTKSGLKPLLIKLLITGVFSIAVTFLTGLWSWSGIFVLLIYLLVDSFGLIFTIHYTYFSNLKLKEMFENKSVIKIMGLYFVSNLIFIIIAVALWFISPILSFFINIPLIAYNNSNIYFTVVRYFKENN